MVPPPSRHAFGAILVTSGLPNTSDSYTTSPCITSLPAVGCWPRLDLHGKFPSTTKLSSGRPQSTRAMVTDDRNRLNTHEPGCDCISTAVLSLHLALGKYEVSQWRLEALATVDYSGLGASRGRGKGQIPFFNSPSSLHWETLLRGLHVFLSRPIPSQPYGPVWREQLSSATVRPLKDCCVCETKSQRIAR